MLSVLVSNFKIRDSETHAGCYGPFLHPKTRLVNFYKISIKNTIAELFYQNNISKSMVRQASNCLTHYLEGAGINSVWERHYVCTRGIIPHLLGCFCSLSGFRHYAYSRMLELTIKPSLAYYSRFMRRYQYP